MKSIFDVLAAANEQFADLKETLIKGRDALVMQRNHYPDLAEALDPQIASLTEKIALLDNPFDADALLTLGTTVFNELRHFKYTPTTHAGSGI